MTKCKICGEPYNPINSVDENGDWDGSCEQNCDCDTSAEGLRKELKKSTVHIGKVRLEYESFYSSDFACIKAELPQGDPWYGNIEIDEEIDCHKAKEMIAFLNIYIELAERVYDE